MYFIIFTQSKSHLKFIFRKTEQNRSITSRAELALSLVKINKLSEFELSDPSRLLER